MQKKKVLIVDDSAVVRGMIARLLRTEDDIEVCGSASNGQMAVNFYKKERPHIVLLDIQMPVMDGTEALKEILSYDRKAKVVMVSTLTQKNAKISLEALQLGAVDYVPKPESTSELNSSAEFKECMLRIIRGIAIPEGEPEAPSQKEAQPAPEKKPAPTARAQQQDINKRALPPRSWKPEVIAIGSSTGGPQALFQVLASLKDASVPIVITQHMPATFTAVLAQHIRSQTGLECEEAEEGMPLQAGKVYVALGGKHMVFKKENNGSVVIKIDDGPVENFCKPAVDPMMRSLIDIYGSRILAVILTGMGNDGQKGCEAVVNAGGYVITQDAETSVVWGMPGAVATAGLCSEILPLNEIGPWISKKI